MLADKDLKVLFEMQRKLDKHIIKNKGLEGKDLLVEKILALQVEIAELANETRCFKYWSNKKADKKKVLEEYVDCLHFILSIGLDLKKEMFGEIINLPKDLPFALSWLIRQAGHIKHQWEEVTGLFLHLGIILGLKWEEVVTAYMDKNKINHDRQESGY